jgi:Macrocin-O-methyltransferase (TylF)
MNVGLGRNDEKVKTTYTQKRKSIFPLPLWDKGMNAPVKARSLALQNDRQNTGAAIDLYLDLLKASLTNTLFVSEPNADDEGEPSYVKDFIEHYIKGVALSMLPLARLENLQSCIFYVLKQEVAGDLIETGVWRGGATIFMRGVLKAFNVVDRIVWVADSFEGLPEPDAERFPLEARAHDGQVMRSVYNHFAVSLEDVKRNFRAYGLLDKQVCFLKGWFKDTLPAAPMTTLSIMRLDGDYYESTWDALINLYDKLSLGGYAIVDDYGEGSWTYCRRAVDEFRRQRGIQDPMIRVDSKCYYWQRTR